MSEHPVHPKDLSIKAQFMSKLYQGRTVDVVAAVTTPKKNEKKWNLENNRQGQLCFIYGITRRDYLWVIVWMEPHDEFSQESYL